MTSLILFAWWTGKHQPSALERKVHQADSFKVRTSADAAAAEDGEEEEAEKYEGPTSIVVVKDPVSAWERMKDRLRVSMYMHIDLNPFLACYVTSHLS